MRDSDNDKIRCRQMVVQRVQPGDLGQAQFLTTAGCWILRQAGYLQDEKAPPTSQFGANVAQTKQ